MKRSIRAQTVLLAGSSMLLSIWLSLLAASIRNYPSLTVLGTSTPTLSAGQLQKQVRQMFSSFHFRDDLCPLAGQEQPRYDHVQELAMAQLLAAPETQHMKLDELAALFTAGIRSAIGFDSYFWGDTTLLAEKNGYVLVMMYHAFCTGEHSHVIPSPHIYVFSRTGEFWYVCEGTLTQVRWMDDRWVGFYYVSSDGSAHMNHLVHIVQNGSGWQLLTFDHILRGPGLVWFDFEMPPIGFLDSYRKIFVSAQASQGMAATKSGAPPCDFGDQLAILLHYKQSGISADPILNIIYDGNMVFEWANNQYALLERESHYWVTIILSDGTQLWSDPPGQADMAKSSRIRPGTWHDYCVGSDIGTVF